MCSTAPFILWVIRQHAKFLDVQIDAHLIEYSIAEFSSLVRQQALREAVMPEIVVTQAFRDGDHPFILHFVIPNPLSESDRIWFQVPGYLNTSTKYLARMP